MSNARNLANIIAGTYEIPAAALDNAVPADGSITQAKLADDSVGAGEIINSAVTTNKVADGAITAAKIAAGTIPESSSALAASYDLSSGASVTANKVAALNADGTVTAISAPPAEGTKTVIFTGQTLSGQMSEFPTRGMNQTSTGTNNYNTTLVPFAITSSGRVSGSTYNIGTCPSSSYAFGASIDVDESQTEGVFYVNRQGYNNTWEWTSFVGFATGVVDSSGNMTLGSINTNQLSTLGISAGAVYGVPIARIVDNVFYCSAGNQSLIVYPKTAGTPNFYSGKSADVANLGLTGQTFFANSNAHMLRLRSDGTASICSWSGSSIGSPTNQTLFAGSNAKWVLNTSRTRAFAAYTDAEGNFKVSGFTINASTGALTLVNTYIYQKVWSAIPTKLTFVSDTYLVVTTSLQASSSGGSNYHIAFQIDASGNVLSAGSKTTTISSASPYALSGVFIGQSSSSRTSWTPVSTSGWVAPNIAGITKSTTSVSPASIVFNGVMSGFTGLVPGSKYYLADALDGTLSSTIPTLTYPTEIGTAISATDLNININSFNPNTLTQYTLPQNSAVGAYYVWYSGFGTFSVPGTWRQMSSSPYADLYLRIA
jgi:hypothetical protein